MRRDLHRGDPALQPAALQDLVEVLPDVVKAAVGMSLRFQLQISLGEGEAISFTKAEKVNKSPE